MLKLFIRLYIFIILALLLITTLLDSVLLPRYQEPSTTPDALVNLIQQTTDTEQLEQMLRTSDYDWHTQWVLADNMSWPATQQTELNSNGYTQSYSDINGQTIEHIYIKFDDKLLRIDIPLVENDTPFLFYIGLLFSLFAIALGLWLLPLWKELLQVKRAADAFDKHGQFPHINVSNATTLTSVLNSFNSLTDRINELLASQQALSGTLAHEIRTPLARLKFRLEQLPPEQSQIKTAIQGDIDGMQHLLQTLLDYTRMQSLNPELNVTKLPLHTLVDDITNQWPTSCQQTIKITSHLNEAFIMADGALVERAISNLLSNAHKYTKDCITVSIELDENWVSIKVTDNGQGIHQDDFEVIFKPFVQVANTTKTAGAGIGLALVGLIQRWHEGTAEVSSSLGRGTTFTLKYPR